MPVARCRVCQAELDPGGQGRPPRYCSAACRQRAYRARKESPAAVKVPRRARGRENGSASPVEREVPHLGHRELLAWRGVLETYATIIPALEAELRQQTALTLSEFDVLYQIWQLPDKRIRMGDLSRAVLVTPSGVTRLVARLEERGLVQRVRSQGKQAVVTRLTDKGDEVLQAAMDVHFQGVKRMFIQHLGEADIERMIATWSRIRHLNPAGDVPEGEAGRGQGS